MEVYKSIRHFLLPMGLLFLLILTGCSGTVEKGRKPSEDWSRGLPIGLDASSHATFTVDPAGDAVHVVWPFQPGEGESGLRYIQLNEEADVTIDQVLLNQAGAIRTPQLISGDDKQLYLFWAGKGQQDDNWGLWYTALDKEGEITSSPQLITDLASNVGSFIVISDGRGGAMVVWEETTSQGLNWIQITPGMQVLLNPDVLVKKGVMPSIQVDSLGDFHVTWMEDELLFYGKFSLGESTPITGTEVARISTGTGVSLDDPVLGLSDGWIYIFWSILNQSGLEAGTATTEFISFPLGAPRGKFPSRFGVYPDEIQPFEPYQGVFALSQLVPSINPIYSTDFVYAPSVAQMQLPELAVAVATQQEYRLNIYDQVAVGLFEGGQLKGYTFCTKTFDISGDVVLTSDSNGNLHVIWRDGYAGNRVFYATTTLDAKENIDRLGFTDLSTVILTGGLESLTGIMLFPLAFPWLLGGLVILVVWRLVRNDETLANTISRILLFLSLCLYQGSKFLIMPTIIDYVPFSAWIDLPPSWHLPLRIGIPLTIFTVAIIVAEILRRKFTLSTLMYYMAIALVDTILTLSIYGVNFLGAY